MLFLPSCAVVSCLGSPLIRQIKRRLLVSQWMRFAFCIWKSLYHPVTLTVLLTHTDCTHSLMAQPECRKENTLCVIISFREKVSNVYAERRELVHWKAIILTLSPFLFCRRPQTDDLACISSTIIASGQGVPLPGPAHRFTTETSGFCSILQRSFQEPNYCMCQPHLSCSCTTLKQYVLQFEISWLTTIVE